MKMAQENELLKAIYQVYDGIKASNMATNKLKPIKAPLVLLANYLGVTQRQALFFSIIVKDSFTEDKCGFEDVASHLGLEVVQLLQFMDDLLKLEKKGILIAAPKRYSGGLVISNREYTVKADIVNALILNQTCPKAVKPVSMNLLDTIGEVYQQMKNLNDEKISVLQYDVYIAEVLRKNTGNPFFEKLQSLNCDWKDISILCYVIWKSVLGGPSVDIEKAVEALCRDEKLKVDFYLGLKDEKNPLVRNRLLEIIPNQLLNDMALKISPKLRELLREQKVELTIEKNERGVILPQNIAEIKLFYNELEGSQIQAIYSVLMEENYQNLQRRLKEKNLALGVNILLYGSPGTGKTESVKQIARATGREIMKIEISQTLSAWYGESEKIIKKIFLEYAEYAERSSNTPILLFNEADGILGTRHENQSGAVAQTHNRIQNVLLEELENFKGIFMATTNLAGNLDKAFERRFLFKLEFNKPCLEARMHIWQTRFPNLPPAYVEQLARDYDLSGGQIDNILRKSEINYLLSGEPTAFDSLKSYCEEERRALSHHKRPIGFQ